VSVSELATELHVSVKTIETHQMRMKEKLALHSTAELRQKAREWLAKSAITEYGEVPEPEQGKRSLFPLLSKVTFGASSDKDAL
jgi:DNA-binding MurR/RpiR family transcriptional regulator